MNGNVTKSGIEADLTWMSRIGIGGIQNFDAGLAIPQVVPERLAFMSSGWKDAFRYSAALADKLCMEMTIAASPGWSETGGPWVTPEDAMKKLVWSETTVRGGTNFDGALPPPPAVTGPFQDVPMARPGAGEVPALYHDVAVTAYRVDAGDDDGAGVVTSNGRRLPIDLLTDGRLATGVDVDKGTSGAPGAIVITFDRPRTMRSLVLGLDIPAGGLIAAEFHPVLEASDDGIAWRRVTDVPLGGARETTVAFAPTTARLFRVLLARNHFEELGEVKEAPKGAVVRSFIPSFPAVGTTRLTELRLSPVARVHRAEAKAGFTVEPDYYELASDVDDADRGARPPASSETVDLTKRVGADGRLRWRVPAGRWKIVRLGYSLLGTTNHPASPEATGLEVDKFDAAAVGRYLRYYLDRYRDAAGGDLFGGHGVEALLTDSIEVGPSNWTGAMIDEFRRRRGYDMIPWLPVLTGAVIGSQRQSDGFLYDFRRTIADLYAEAHYKVVAEIAHRDGLKVYGEALESGRPSLGDDMQMRRYTDVPMSAIWAYQASSKPRVPFLADMKGASSVSHVYGQNLAAAESFTSSFSPWAFAPADLKRVADLEFAYGINRPVIHTSVHQPTEQKPGLSLLYFGQYFNRHETWAPFARPWIDYLGRSAFLLQQGRNVADVAYFYGEEAPLTALYDKTPVADAPTRYGFDFVDAGAVREDLSVRDGRIVSDGGADYRLLWLGGSSGRMTLAMLRRLSALVADGATIAGPKPTGSPALTDDPAAFADLAGRMWAGGSDTRVGKGHVIAASDVEAALRQAGARSDFEHDRADGAELLFLHRHLDGGEIYYVNNRTQRPVATTGRFRVTGYAPELWHADTGKAEPASYRTDGENTLVDLSLGSEEAVFVMFRARSSARERHVTAPVQRVVATLDRPWQVAFEAGRGAPSGIRLDTLRSLSLADDPGVRYFSGVSTYRTSVKVPGGGAATAPLMLDLGTIGDVAQVTVNGRVAGIAWKSPYRVDVSGLLHAGLNTVEVAVANLWVNRLIGDQQPGANKVAFVTGATWRADAPLRPSGLLGPVTLIGSSR